MDKESAGRQRPHSRTPDESLISEELREAQKAGLLLQLLQANGQALTKGEANRFKNLPGTSLGLKPGLANYRRAQLAEQGYLRIIPAARTEAYSLTADGLEYLAASTTHLNHATYKFTGKTLNALVTAARESLFRGEQQGPTGPVQSAVPSPAELAVAVLAEFADLRRNRYSHSGLVPIHEVRRRIGDRFGPSAARHEVLDEVVLDLWRQKRLGLEAISNLSDATEQQLNEGIVGAHGTLFYLEAPREQAAAAQSL